MFVKVYNANGLGVQRDRPNKWIDNVKDDKTVGRVLRLNI